MVDAAETLLPPPNASLVAAGRRLDLTDIAVRRALAKSGQNWQDSAWAYYDTVPEVGFAARYVGNMLSRLRLFPAYVPEAGSDPIALNPEDPEQQALGLAPIAEAAIAALDRISGSSGDTGTVTGPLGIDLTIPGDGYLVGYRDSASPSGECWEVLSTDEVKVDDRETRILRGPDDKEGEVLDPQAVFIRIWNRHPRWRNLADSAMRQLLDPCEELSLLTQGIRSSATSRLSAGLLLIPSELTFVQQPTAAPDETLDPQQDKFLMTMVQGMSLPIQDPSSASAIIPLILRGPSDKLAEVRHMVLERPYDDLSMRQRTELRSVLATGLDLPAEIILGLSDSNHWTAWAVDNQTYKAHLDPKALTICGALTTEYLHPALMAAGFLPDRIIVWRDPSDLIADPDVWARSLDAHKEIVISDAALRRSGGFAEEDAPDEEEAAARADRGRPTAPPGAQPGGPPAPDQVEEGPPPEPEAEAATLTLVAATAPALRRGGSLDRLAKALAQIDRALRDRIQARADAAVLRALEIAGGKVRRRVNGSAKAIPDDLLRTRAATLKESVRAMEHDQICARLGETTVRALGLEDEDLIDDQLGGINGSTPASGTLAAFYLSQTQRAYQESRRLMLRELDSSLSPGELADLETADRVNIERGFAVLAAAIGTTIRSALFQATPTAPARGEFSADVRVPPGQIRESIAVAGGAPSAAPDPVTGQPSGGIATGEASSSLMAQMFGITADGGRWVYGDPSARHQPFDLHLDLDGVDFASWSDPVLQNPDSWPPVPFLFPGDHDNCQCDFIPALELGEPIDAGLTAEEA